jgi:16S rRNA (adenine1518-N6/adenine1519-N6)-dimethyltransferase
MKQLKALGQVFLENKAYLKDILDAASIKSQDQVLEVGPGQGALTNALLEVGAKVLAIEKDPRMVSYLKLNIKDINFQIIEGDVREEYENIIKDIPLPFKIVANIPYYLTSFLLRMILENNPKPENCVLMIQQEVAERLIAKGDRESLLSLSVKYYGEVSYIIKVPRSAFKPQPKVDSAIVKIIPNKEEITDKEFSDKFFQIIKVGFSHPRKLVLSNLKNGFSQNKEKFDQIFQELKIPLKARAENIGIET